MDVAGHSGFKDLVASLPGMPRALIDFNATRLLATQAWKPEVDFSSFDSEGNWNTSNCLLKNEKAQGEVPWGVVQGLYWKKEGRGPSKAC